jgi:hypothetical protein
MDIKDFMEFWSKEYGATFVDADTGEDVLARIRAERVCPNCEHVIKGDGKILHEGDMVCGNPQADYLSDFRAKDDTCRLWTKRSNSAKKREGEANG